MCNGNADCSDQSDELNCRTRAPSLILSGTCPDDEFQCADSTCIPLKFQCDGTKDCLDGTDENDCNEHPICHEDEKLCQIDQKCIPKDYWCDKDPDCTDGSDEKDCPIDDLKCNYPSWRCDNDSKCLDVKDLCNGQFDCEDETDEGARCQFNLCADFNTCSGMYFYISFTFYYLIMRVIVMIFKS